MLRADATMALRREVVVVVFRDSERARDAINALSYLESCSGATSTRGRGPTLSAEKGL
jgi:hypothetical protein